ncbi:kinase non-catalytic C-lobe domain-containing protein 1-like isoform X2 [Solea solea]|uniref:kinase non-catalytic C-lobe domain-containing protein 1-like isoform X2 n=1 Tax=Solea solea TaxID=90069 RepID=UPI0027296828|nr:kinase non-catalytic C-lobe domain-containing protein 1-like isoform X2 [Solea solea]
MQGMFQGCHPVHFLNSRVQGIRDNVLIPNGNVSQHIPPAGGSSVQVYEGTPSDSHVQQLHTYADSVTKWISSEIAQVTLVTKYLWMGKHCYESRNFATTMQVLGGLENVTVRQLPVWKHLPSKVFEILEELRAVQLEIGAFTLTTGAYKWSKLR